VILVMVYAVLQRVWSVWALTTHHVFGTEPGDPTLVTPGQLAAVTAANVVIFILFARAVPRVRHNSLSLQKGHYAGLVIGVVVVILLQLAALQGHAQFGVYGLSPAGGL
ncbi:MAG: hypothetical protein P1V35_17420, partial [Planctomycetota bacterium]|nr:hypothetical protein [Planctomycetota bacterium]